MTRTFTISTDVTGETRDFEMAIYEDTVSLIADSEAWSAKYELRDGAGFEGTRAVVQAHSDEWIEDNPEESVAVVRFSLEDLDIEVIAHESVHLAQHLYGLDFSDERPVWEHMHAGNEDFAYTFTEVFGTLLNIVETLEGAND